MRFTVFYVPTLDVDAIVGCPTLESVDIEADSVMSAKRSVIRCARAGGLIDADDMFRSDWLDYHSRGYWLRPLNVGTRGFGGGLCLYRVADEVLDTSVASLSLSDSIEMLSVMLG